MVFEFSQSIYFKVVHAPLALKFRHTNTFELKIIEKLRYIFSLNFNFPSMFIVNWLRYLINAPTRHFLVIYVETVTAAKILTLPTIHSAWWHNFTTSRSCALNFFVVIGVFIDKIHLSNSIAMVIHDKIFIIGKELLGKSWLSTVQ